VPHQKILPFPLRARGAPADWTFIPPILESSQGWAREHFVEVTLALVLGLTLPKERVEPLRHSFVPQHPSLET
jgi:hypothetical protein